MYEPGLLVAYPTKDLLFAPAAGAGDFYRFRKLVTSHKGIYHRLSKPNYRLHLFDLDEAVGTYWRGEKVGIREEGGIRVHYIESLQLWLSHSPQITLAKSRASADREVTFEKFAT